MTTQQILYASAAAASLISLGAHALLGGRLIARKVLADPSVTARYRLPFLYCWHFVSVALAAMAAGFAYLAIAPANAPLAVFLTASAFSGSALSILVAQLEGAPAIKMPPTSLFAIVAILGAAAIIAG